MNLTKSRIFLYFCISFIAGIAAASFWAISYFLNGIFLIIAIVCVTLFWPVRAASQPVCGAERGDWSEGVAGEQKKRGGVVFGFCLIFLVAGICRFQAEAFPGVDDIGYLNGKGNIALQGVVDEEPDVRSENQKIVVRVVNIIGSTRVVGGKVLATTEKYPGYNYGDKVEISGKLQEPENFSDSTGSEATVFDYQAYLAKDDIYSVMYFPKIILSGGNSGNPIESFLFKIKKLFEDKLLKIFPEPQASLADGLILGEKAGLPKALTDAFAVVGITHIIALSGFNITIIADNLRKLFNSLMLSRAYSFWLTVIFIIGFVVMTGASASIVRAGVMGILIVLARKSGRIYNIRNALALAAAAMIYFNPKVLRFDLGFQLSFLATLGLVYISPLIEKYFQWLPEKFGLRGIGIATFSAQIAVFPLLLSSFGRLSLISPVANILVLPFVPLAMFVVFLSAIAGFAWIKLGIFIGWFGWLLLTYQIKVAEFLAKIPFASVSVKIGGILVVAVYAALWGTVIKRQKSKIKMQNDNVRLKML
jgi:competence protein ComEC